MQDEARQSLSGRQMEIANLVATGKSTREIAETLFLSRRTVEHHIEAIFNKIGVGSRVELTAALLGEARLSADSRANSARTNFPAERTSLLGRAATGAARHNLPTALTAFLGRESQLADIATLLDNNRLVTITGSGGVGKTRAALQVGAALLETLADGAWLIDLAPLFDANLVATAVAHALRIEERPDRSLLDTLVETLSDRTVLLIFDNCEHVVVQAAAVALELLGECPHLRVLATSRDPLRVAGEQTYRLPSMNVPSAQEARTINAALAVSYEALDLFAERARGADHRFALTDANAPAVAEICRRLDGVPLAIELAAARINMLPVARIAENLDRRFELLTVGSRDSPARHQTMRALVDWSFDLLTKDEQLVFVRLSIFADGCTLPVATAVCSGDGIEEAVVFALLASLVDKSLVVADLTERAPRYRLLESFRAYGREKLRHSGVESLLIGRFASALLALAKEIEVAYESATDAIWRTATRVEIDNWRAALQWSLISRCDIALGQELVATLHPLWFHFLPREGRRWISIAREASDGQIDHGVSALLDLADSLCAAKVREYAVCLPLAERALRGLAGARAALAQYSRLRTLVRLERASEAEPSLREALRSAQSLKATRFVALLHGGLSRARFCDGDIAAARAHVSESHAAFSNIQDARGIAIALRDSSEIEFIAGDLQTALHLINDSISVSAEVDDIDLWAHIFTNKATYLIALGRYDEARSIAREALAVSSRHQQPACVAFALNNLASIAVLTPYRDTGDRAMQMARAARAFGFTDSYYAITCHGKREPVDQKVYDLIYLALRDAMPEADLRDLMMLGAQRTEDETIREALLI